MMRRVLLIIGCGLAALLAACGVGADDPALVTEHAALAADVQGARVTATYLRDRLQITVEYVQTAVTQVALEGQELAVTLQAAGVNTTAIAQVRPADLNTATPSPQPPPAPGTPPPVATRAGTLPPQSIIVPTPTAGQPALYNAVLAAEVGENDCALAALTRFAPTAERIYVVATAANITPGTTLGAVWSLDGQTLATQDFTPDFSIVQNCVWFYVDPTDFPFTPGTYSVKLSLAGQPSTPPVTFTIVEG